MSSKVITAPLYVEKIDNPLIFLAGPIQGAKRWQDRAIEIIQGKAPELYIASPRRELDLHMDFDPDEYDRQVDWETYYLRKAGDIGVIMFWLAKEYEHLCERSYAQTSRVEWGEWKVLHQWIGANIVVGFEEGFTGARYMKKKLSEDCPDVPVCSDLEETCNEAIRLASLKK